MEVGSSCTCGNRCELKVLDIRRWEIYVCGSGWRSSIFWPNRIGRFLGIYLQNARGPSGLRNHPRALGLNPVSAREWPRASRWRSDRFCRSLMTPPPSALTVTLMSGVISVYYNLHSPRQVQLHVFLKILIYRKDR